MRTVLLTGFEPFAGDAVNPSGDAVRALAARWRGPERLITEVLPVTFDGATARLAALLEEHRPDVVVATGLAGGRAAVTPERVAVNLADARIPDNAGHRPQDAPVVDGGPAAYFATLPVKAIGAALTDRGIPSTVSHTAGTFVCNAVMYAALHATDGAPVRAGFVHLPWADGTGPGDVPSLPFDRLVDALEVAVRVSLDAGDDAGGVGGEIS
ncbi:pyroglutamyl-peptidase I [Microbacterium sp. CnD16-F]|uniref:pyroglutamyl-peptidase I n=1 Tax=unclassified Microbacterium TaxID=2609290 RepID=UPI002097BBCB|nr:MULTISPECIES: pyroglutamyl-peptidase I [unclassified Microbacterium]MCO7204452.1 pyroglutamyl-peptidase I [Microbacterium sp. CnD16-F]MDT0179610.1 pyroglutamyl-peptidase I [Microbacterium sp. ARD31]